MPQAPGEAIAQRVRLHPCARPVRRDADKVQFGLSPGSGIVVAGLTEAEAGWLLSLAAPRRAHAPMHYGAPGVLLASAGGWGLSAARALELLGVLQTHGLIADDRGITDGSTRAQEVSGRSARQSATASANQQVCVLGHGGVPGAIRDHLSASGAANVIDAFDLTHPAALCLVVVRDAIGPRERASWVRSGLAHMPIVIHHRRAVLGPLVGVEGVGPCLVCLDLARRDRDTAWPLIASQLDDVPADGDADVSADVTLTGTVASLTAMLVRAHLDGIQVPTGVTWEVSLPWPHVVTRHWSRHVSCVEHDG